MNWNWWTYNINERKITFLDVDRLRNPNDTSSHIVNRKPINIDHYTHSLASCIYWSKAAKICTSDRLHVELAQMKERLSELGYPENFMMENVKQEESKWSTMMLSKTGA